MKRKIFEQAAFEMFNEDENYDTILYRLLRTYDIFQKDVPVFKKLSPAEQFSFCSTTLLMCTATATHNLNRIRIITEKELNEHTKKYSIEYGFIQPERLTLQRQKLLK